MNKSPLLVGTLLLSFAAGLAYTRPVPQDDDPTPLAEEMGGLQSGQRKLRKLIKNPEAKQETLEIIRGMEQNAITAINLAPAIPAGMEEAKQAAWTIGYKREMVKVLDALLVMELAVVEGRTDAAAAAYKGLGELKKSGHDTYQE